MAKIDRDNNYKIIAKSIINKLYSCKAWGTGHLLVDRFKSGLPGHFKGNVNDVINDLIQQEIIKVYGKTKYGTAIYLNIKKKREIDEMRR